MGISVNDVVDAGFVSEAEMVSDGSTSFRSESIVSIISGTISFAANTALINYDDPIQAGDLVVISGNAAAGIYTVSAANLNLDDFEVDEPIVDAVGGTVDFHHPAGATRVGLGLTGLTRISTGNVQTALSELDGAQPNAHAASHLENASDEIFAEDLGAQDSGEPGKVMVTTGTGGWEISDDAIISAFPTELNTAEDAGLSSTTSNLYQNKLTLTTFALSGGDYIILYQCVLSGTQNGTVFAGRATLDAIVSPVLTELVLKSSANNTQLPFFGHAVRTLSAGIHTVEIDWKRDSGGGSAEIRQARISLWKVDNP